VYLEVNVYIVEELSYFVRVIGRDSIRLIYFDLQRVREFMLEAKLALNKAIQTSMYAVMGTFNYSTVTNY